VFYKHSRLEKRLRESGRPATAEILSMRTEGGGHSARRAEDDDLSQSWTLCRLHLKVMPDGEPAFETSLRTRLHTFKYKGDAVPVLYDPDDHDKVVVDSEAELRSTDALTEEASEFTERAAEFAGSAAAFREQAAAFRARAEAGALHGSDPVAQLERLAALHATGALTDAEFAAEKAKIVGGN
jgi:Short C-terminal domain